MTSGEAVVPARAPAATRSRARAAVPLTTWELRRRLRLVVGFIWLLDGVLQLQAFFFTRNFSRQFLLPLAGGNPTWIKNSITWVDGGIAHHATTYNALFAFVQIAIGVGIVWKPTVKVALAGSIAWALAVWWWGEGLGGLVTNAASPATGAPGAVLIYALLAVLLWPTGHRDQERRFVAAEAVGTRAARVIWVILWGGFAYLILQPQVRSPQALNGSLVKLEMGEPSWIVTMDRHAAHFVAHRGLEFSAALAVIFVLVAVAVWLPTTAARWLLGLAVLVSALIWIFGENFGGIFTGIGTDPNSGPLLIVLVCAYWPLRSRSQRSDVDASTSAAAMPPSPDPQSA